MSKSQGLRHVKASQQGEQVIPEFVVTDQMAADLAFQDAPNKTTVANRVFKLLETRNGDVYVNGESFAINPKTKKKEKIRLLGPADPIWETEQRHLDAKYLSANRRSLKFIGPKGICLVPVDDAAMTEFSEVCEHNISGPNGRGKTKHAYFEWDPAKQQQEALLKEQRRIEAMQIAFTEPDMLKIQKHLTFLGVRLIDQMGFPLTGSGLRKVYALYADKHCDTFMDTKDLPAVEVTWLVKKAISDAKIDLGRQPNMAHWATGGFICNVPAGSTDAAKYLIELAMMKSEEGRSFLLQLQQVVQ